MRSLGAIDRYLGLRTGGAGLARLADCPNEGLPNSRPTPCRVAAVSAPWPRVYRNPSVVREIMRRSSIRRHCLAVSLRATLGSSCYRGRSNPASPGRGRPPGSGLG